MRLVNISTWGEILVSDLFEHIERGKGSGAGSFMDGETPYIAASFADNGYVRDVDDANGSLSSEGNCIAMIVNGNGGVGRNTYQAERFVGSSDLQLGYHRRLNQWNGLFLVACLNKSIERYNYSFAWKRTGEAFAKETVFLPVLADGSPDWGGMERIMRHVVEKQKDQLAFIEKLKGAPRTNIDVSDWGQFQIGELFDVSRPPARSLNRYLSGETPFVASGNFNNGVVDFVEPLAGEQTEPGNCLTVSPLDGATFYQPTDFLGRGGAGSAIIMLRNPLLTPGSGLFMANVIGKSLTQFSYSDQLNMTSIAEQTIRVPLRLGAPDWEYMESTMNTLLKQKAADLGILEQLLPQSEVPEEV